MIVVSDEIDINNLGDLQLELDESFRSWLESEELTEHYQDWLNRTQFQDDREYQALLLVINQQMMSIYLQRKQFGITLNI